MKRFCQLLGVSVSVVMVGCSVTNAPQMPMPDVEQVRAVEEQWRQDMSLEAIKGISIDGSIKEALEKRMQLGDGSRYQALQDTAYKLGIQSGLYSRRQHINEMLGKTQPQLSRLFDFSQYMLPGNVFPPVITETNGMVEKNGRTELRGVRHSFHILTMPVLLIEPPTYLNYLVRHYPEPEMPDPIRWPNGDIEAKNWRVWVQEGWGIGQKQADMQYESDTNRLERDLKGIRLFHDLAAKGVISMPRLAKQDFGLVKSKDGRTLNIGDEVITIVTDSEFQPSEEWTPIIGESIGE